MLARTTNNFRVSPMEFNYYDASHIKSMREDFNDMFQAEATYREQRGDWSCVFCLTYNDEHLHVAYGHNMLDSDDLKRFSKASRFEKFLNRTLGYSFDFVSVGEFGEGGVTHNYHGKRGKGNNPHYHCVGWFHKIGKRNQSSLVKWFLKKNIPLYLTTYTDEELLPLLVRFEWQGCLDNDPLAYACNPRSRSLGLGFVKLDGPIRFSSAGGSYISKYIGKDIKKLYSSTYKDGYVPQLVSLLRDAVDEELVELPLERDYFLYLFLRKLGKFDLANSLHYTVPSDMSFFKQLGIFDDAIKCGSVAHCVYERLLEIYKLFDEEYNSFLSNRYAPKVRKFHCFGYGLLNSANKVKGTYEMTKNGVHLTRQLPPSLCRFLYYDFKRVMSDDVVHGQHYVVKYFLNPLGRKHLRETLVSSLKKDVLLARSCGSANLKDNACLAAGYNSIRLFQPVCKFPLPFYVHKLYELISSFDKVVGYSLMCRQTFVFDEVYKDDRTFLDWDSLCKKAYPEIYDAAEELRNLRNKVQEEKNNKDRDYINHANICYMFNY